MESQPQNPEFRNNPGNFHLSFSNGQLSIDKQNIKHRDYYNLLNSAF